MKKNYISPRVKVLPIQAQLLESWSMNNGLNDGNHLNTTNNRGVLFRNGDVLSRESNDYWDDGDDEE